jgi:hypothetical protein
MLISCILRSSIARGSEPLSGVAEAGDGVIVDHPDGLHERVADGRPDEPEALPLELLAEGA